MALINYNLKQITNDKIPPNTEIKDGYYVFEMNPPVLKFGYICEPSAISLPIYITFEDKVERKITIGKTGMFEVQRESEMEKDSLIILGFRIPVGIKFTVDYITEASAT